MGWDELEGVLWHPVIEDEVGRPKMRTSDSRGIYDFVYHQVHNPPLPPIDILIFLHHERVVYSGSLYRKLNVRYLIFRLLGWAPLARHADAPLVASNRIEWIIRMNDYDSFAFPCCCCCCCPLFLPGLSISTAIGSRWMSTQQSHSPVIRS